MEKILIFVVLALTASPQPTENYCADISLETAQEIQELVINGQYREYLDFNGDNELNMADVVSVSKRYADNCKYGNEITVDREVIDSIIEENYSEMPIYWEIDFVNGNVTREYSLTVQDITTANIYFEFEDYSENVEIEINPFTETVEVKS